MTAVRAALVILLTTLSSTATADPCAPRISAVRGQLMAARRSKDSFLSYLKKARTSWAQIPSDCRGGAWFVAAANILRQPENRGLPLEAGPIKLATPKDALEAGLQAAPGSAELLAYLAHYGRVAPESAPPLPNDACERLATLDKDQDPDGANLRAYVCAVALLQTGNKEQAAEQLAAITAPAKFPDVAALRAEVAAPERGRSLIVRLACDPFCPSPAAALAAPPR